MKTRAAVRPDCHKAASIPHVRAIILVGFMGAGKTCVGKELANLLGWKFEDLDLRIQAQEGRSIAEIFSACGEAGFRRAEEFSLQASLRELSPSGSVIALGGGAFVQEKNAALLAAPGLVTVFLDAPAPELFDRCRRQRIDRPLHQDFEAFRDLYAARKPFYAKATLILETTGKDVSEIAKEIASRLGTQEIS